MDSHTKLARCYWPPTTRSFQALDAMFAHTPAPAAAAPAPAAPRAAANDETGRQALRLAVSPLRAITPAHVEAFARWLADQGLR